MTNRAYTDSRQRQLFKNIVCLGALSALLDMDPAAIEQLLAEQFKGRDKLIAANVQALHMGRDWAQAESDLPDRAAPAPQPTRSATASSSTATAAAGAGRGVWRRDGLRLVSDHAVLLAGRGVHPLLQPLSGSITATATDRFAIVQAEDELASIGMVIGAAWNGARAFTATSGPGISLMQEFIGLAYFAEIPAVIFDVQRSGPSTGMPTRTQQTDMLSCAYASHGDTKHVLLFPEDPHECFEFGALAFDLADRLQTPIFVMLDLEIGMNERLTRPFAWDDSRKHGPRQGDDAAEDWRPARSSAAIWMWTATASPIAPIPARIRPRAPIFTRGTSKDRIRALHRGRRRPIGDNMERLLKKHRHRAVPGAAPAIDAQAKQPTRLRGDLLRLHQPGDDRGR